MADSTTSIDAIPPSLVTADKQSAHTTALAAYGKANEANTAAFLAEITQAELQTNTLTLDSGITSNPTSIQNNTAANEGLLALDTPSLSLFNEVGANVETANANGTYTAQQLQDIGILLKDEQGLEEATNVNSPIPLTSEASTLDLSAEAQGIANGVTPVSSVNTALTSTQLAQLGSILTPLANQPLTQSVLLQVQTQLAAAGINPQQFNFNAIAYVMSSLAAMQASAQIMEANNVNESVDQETVAPAAAIDRVAIEDSAILSE